MAGVSCSLNFCDRDARTRGYCHTHYMQVWRGVQPYPIPERSTATVCTFAGCGAPVKTRGLCHGHYRQFLAGEELRAIVRHAPICTVPGCERRHEAKGLCSMHWKRRDAAMKRARRRRRERDRLRCHECRHAPSVHRGPDGACATCSCRSWAVRRPHTWRAEVTDAWRTATLAWEAELEAAAVGYATEAAEFEAANPRPRLADFMGALSYGVASWEQAA